MSFLLAGLARVAQFIRVSSSGRAMGSAVTEVLAVVALLFVVGGIPGSSLLGGDLAAARRTSPRITAARTKGAPAAPLATSRSVAGALGGPSPDEDGRVLVTVHDGFGGPALPAARVRAFSMVGDRAYPADARATDAEGRAPLTSLRRGETWIVADAPGRARGSTRLVVDGEQRALSIDLAPEHVLMLSVTDERGGPVNEAEVEVLAPGEPLPAVGRIASGGKLRVGRLGAGPWDVSVRASGYEDARVQVEHEADTVDIALRRLGAIRVHVTLSGDRPAAGAHVVLAGATLWPPRRADTDDAGALRVGGLTGGVYAIRASLGDLVSGIELGLSLERGEDKDVSLTMTEGFWVNARVTDGDDEDAPGIAAARLILAEGGLSPFPIEATTDAQGRARLGPIAPGGATLSSGADGFVSRGAVSITDPPPAETRIVLERAAVLSGRVVDDRGYPVGGATLEIIGIDSRGSPILDEPRRVSFRAAHFDAMLAGPAALVATGELGVVPGPVPAIPSFGAFGAFTALDVPHAPPMGLALGGARPVEPWVTRGDGTFRVTPVSPGQVRAIVSHPQYVESQSDFVTLASGAEKRVEVVMRQGGALEGRVVDASDRPVAHARVVVRSVRGTIERTTRTAGDGSFAFAALPEAVSLTASGNDDDQPDVRLTLSIPDGHREEVIVRLPESRLPLDVRVVDDRGYPIRGAQVSASSLSIDIPLRTTAYTDANGDAALRRARGLPMHIDASAPGRAPQRVATEAGSDSLRVVLAEAETALGEIVDGRGGDPVAGAEVTLYGNMGARRTRTDAKGQFRFGELAPGAANLGVRAAGFAPIASPLAVPDTRGRRPFAIPPIELEAEGVIDGDVVDARGDPVAGARVAKDNAPPWLATGISEGTAITDAKGRFVLHELAAGLVAVEAYAPELGRARVAGIDVAAGRRTGNVHIVLAPAPNDQPRPAGGGGPAAGSVAVTLAETAPPVRVIVASVASGSEAERAGMAPGDVVLAVDGASIGTMQNARDKLGGALMDDVVVRLRRGANEVVLRVPREPVR